MTTLGQFAIPRGIQTGPFGSQLHARDYVSNGVGVVMPQDIGANVIDRSRIAKIDDQMARNLGRHKLVPGDIVFSRRGDVTRRALVRSGDGPLICGTGCLRVRLDRSKADPRYVSYRLALETARSWLVRHAVGATMPNLNTGILSNLPIDLPALEVQKRRANLLGALDDKIAANREESVSIDAYLEGLFEASSGQAKVVNLEQVSRVNSRTATHVAGTFIDYIDVGSVYNGGFGFSERIAWEGAPSRARRAVSEGDVLWSTVRPNRRSHALFLGRGRRVVASTGLAVISPFSLKSAELYEATKRPDFQNYLESVAEGSAYPAVRASQFNQAPIMVLEGSGRQRFLEVAQPLRDLQWSRREESLRLAATRDELLPLLMNGKITVKDAEKTVEDVV